MPAGAEDSRGKSEFKRLKGSVQVRGRTECPNKARGANIERTCGIISDEMGKSHDFFYVYIDLPAQPAQPAQKSWEQRCPSNREPRQGPEPGFQQNLASRHHSAFV